MAVISSREICVSGLKVLFQHSQFSCRRQVDVQDFFARNLRERIEMAQGFKFVAKEFKPHRPRAGERPNIENAAAQGDVTFLRDLRLRFVGLLFKPFDQVEGIDLVASRKRTDTLVKLIASEGALEEGSHAGYDEGRCGLRVACRVK